MLCRDLKYIAPGPDPMIHPMGFQLPHMPHAEHRASLACSLVLVLWALHKGSVWGVVLE